MQGKIFRVAHLGFFDYLDTVALLGAMEHIAKDTLGLKVEYGQAVAAAQKVYAKAGKQLADQCRTALNACSDLSGINEMILLAPLVHSNSVHCYSRSSHG